MHIDPAPAPTPAPAVGDDELERFRREWKDEVARKVPAQAAATATATATAAGEKKGAASAAAVPGHVKAAEPVTAKDNGAVKGYGKGKSKALPRDIPRTSPAAVTAALDADLAADLSRVRLTSPHTSISTLPQSPTRSPIKASRRLSALSTSPTKIPFPVRAPTGVHGPGADAVGIYASAVEAEQSGRLNDALRLYRTAFKLDDNVDRLYARQVARDVARAAEAVDEDELTVEDVVDPTAPPEAEYTFRRHIQVHPDHESGASRQSKLTALLSSAETADSTFMPADETLPVPLARLPAELVEPILAHLDVGAIEAFGGTCWRARALTAYAGVWRRIVRGIYRPPMLPPRLACAELARRHRGEWRTVLVEEERVRMDGCYIAVCHYVRPGAGEEWVAVTHMITYHRFLRFYPDGTVISFLTTEHPSDVVPNLNPSLRGKGLHFGRWRLIRSDDVEEGEKAAKEEEMVTDDKEDKAEKTDKEDKADKADEKDLHKNTKANKKNAKNTAKKRAYIQITDLLEPGVADPKYEFEMELALRETNRGRWNKLDLARYSTVNLATGEVLHLSLRQQKPFYFSKVRSWSPHL